MSSVERSVVGQVAAVGCAATIALVISLSAAWAPLSRMDAATWAWIAVLAIATFLVNRCQFVLPWRGQRVGIALDGTLILVALVTLPPTTLPALLLLPLSLAQFARRRPLQKAIYNTASVILGGAVAATTFALLSPDLGTTLAAIAGVLAYATVTHGLVAFVLAAAEGTSLRLARRFIGPFALDAGVGVSGGVALVALYRYHPAAVLAAVPFWLLAREYGTFWQKQEHVSLVQARATRLRLELTLLHAPEEVAHAFLGALDDVLAVRSATLSIHQADLRVTRAFQRAPNATRTFQAPLVGADGTVLGLAQIEVDARDRTPTGKMGALVLQLFADEAASALVRIQQDAPRPPLWLDLPLRHERAA